MPKRKTSTRLDDLKAVLQLAADGLKGVGIPGVEGLASVPLRILEFYEELKANDEDIIDLLTTFDSLQSAILDPITKARDQGQISISDDTLDRIKVLSRELARMRETLIPLVSLTSIARWRRRGEIASNIRNVNRDTSRALNRFLLAGQLTVDMLLHDFEAKRVLSSLPRARARFDASEKRPCLDDTRVLLLRKIYEHIFASPGHPFVCLYGSPGTGKSAVAKSIASRLHSEGSLGASYFFDKRGGDAGNISLATFVTTIVYQLAQFDVGFCAAVVRQLKNDPSLTEAVPEVQLNELLLQPIRSIPPPTSRWVIVFDALDECGDSDHQERLVSLLRKCAEAQSHLVIFFTSRPMAAFTDSLQTSSAVAETMDDLDLAQTERDIQAFINAQFDIVLAPEPHIVRPSQQEVGEIASLCGGLFELAALRLRQIAARRKHFLLSVVVRDMLKNARAPKSGGTSLQAVYIDILDAAYDDLIEPDRSAVLGRYRTVVGALASLREPLTLPDFAALIGVEFEEVKKTLQPLSSVIAVPNDAPIHFYHSSFLEFILSPSESEQSTPITPSPPFHYHIPTRKSHIALSRRSFIIMNQMLRRNILGLPDPYIFNNDILDAPKALARHIPAHLHYACLHWAGHLREEGTQDLPNLMLAWCNFNIIFYLEVLSLLGEMERAIPSLLRAQEWATESPALGPTITLLKDSCRLVQMFYPALTRSAGSLYHSAIPFMPSCSLRDVYLGLAVGAMSFIQPEGGFATWPALVWEETFSGEIVSVSYSPDGRRLVCATGQGILRILSATTGRLERVLQGHEQRVTSVAFSPDGENILSGSQDCSVRIWSAATGAETMLLEGHAGSVTSVAWSPDGRQIASGSYDRSVRIWSAQTGEQVHMLEKHGATVRSVAFSPDGARIVSASQDKHVRVWSAATGAEEQVFEGHGGPVASVAFSPDGTRVVSGSGDGSVRVWSVMTGAQELKLFHTDRVLSAAFSPDGAHVVSGASQGPLRVWAATTGAQELVLRQTGRVLSVAFSPEGAHIVSGSGGGALRVWSTTSEAYDQVVAGQRDSVLAVAFSFDGHTLKYQIEFGSTLYWDLRNDCRLNEEQASAQFSASTGWNRTWRLEDGWLRVDKWKVWPPATMRGDCWLGQDVAIMRSKDDRSRLAIVRLPPDVRVSLDAMSDS